MEKVCRTCRKSYENTVEHFQRNTGWKDGLHIHCKACLHERVKAFRSRKPENYKAAARARRNRNIEKARAASRVSGHRRTLAGKGKEQYWKNREAISARKKAEYQKDRTRILAKRRADYANHRDELLTRVKAGYHKNPDPYKARSRERKARLRGADGNVTAADIRNQYAAQKGLCYWCDTPLGKSFDVDHVMPLKLHGEHSPANIVVACCRCNASKRAKHPADFNRDRWERFQRERGAA